MGSDQNKSKVPRAVFALGINNFWVLQFFQCQISFPKLISQNEELKQLKFSRPVGPLPLVLKF